MTTISELDWRPHPVFGDRGLSVITFESGYVANVIFEKQVRGGPEPYEIAILRDGELDDTTPIMNGPIADLTEDEANAVLRRISELPAVGEGGKSTGC